MPEETTTLIHAYKYRLYPNSSQAKALETAFEAGRQIWNEALGLYNVSHRATNNIRDSRFNYENIDKLAAAMEAWETAQDERRECNSNSNVLNCIGMYLRNKRQEEEAWQVLQSDTLTNLINRRMADAIKAYWRKRKEGMWHKEAGWPRFKRPGEFTSLSYRWRGKSFPEHDGKWARVTLPHVGEVRFRYHRPIPEEWVIQQAVVMRAGSQWFITLQVRNKEVPLPGLAQGDAIGLDFGLVNVLSSNYGDVWPAPDWLTEKLPELRRMQRKLDRQRRANNPDNYNEDGTIRRGPKEWHIGTRQQRTRDRVEKLHRHIKDSRWYFWHTITDWLTSHYSVIVIEDLSPQFMLHNKRLARRAADCALFKFKQTLTYKCEERGVQLIMVDPRHTSQTCSACGCVARENRKSQAVFKCIECGHTENADVNAAKNILARGLTELGML